jgi:hypothetical protein
VELVDHRALKPILAREIREIHATGHFATYGVGVSLLDMRDPEKARGRTPVG